MSHPDPYARNFGFTDYARTNPADPLPGLQVDTELNAIKIFLDLLLSNTKLIQRDDGALQNQSVGLDQLKTEVAFGLNDVSDWQTATQYFKLNGVWYNSVLYRCLADHVSDPDFSTDLAAGRWSILVDVASVVDVASDARDAAQAAQAAAELAQTSAETASTTATAQASIATVAATSAGTSESNAAQSEIDVAAAIAGLFDPGPNDEHFIKSDGTTFVPTILREDEFGNFETYGDASIGNNLYCGGELETGSDIIQAGTDHIFEDGGSPVAIIRRITGGLDVSTGFMQFTNGLRADVISNLAGDAMARILQIASTDDSSTGSTTSTSYQTYFSSDFTFTPLEDDSEIYVIANVSFKCGATASHNQVEGQLQLRNITTDATIGFARNLYAEAQFDAGDDLAIEQPMTLMGRYSSTGLAAGLNIRYRRINAGTTATIKEAEMWMIEVGA